MKFLILYSCVVSGMRCSDSKRCIRKAEVESGICHCADNEEDFLPVPSNSFPAVPISPWLLEQDTKEDNDITTMKPSYPSIGLGPMPLHPGMVEWILPLMKNSSEKPFLYQNELSKAKLINDTEFKPVFMINDHPKAEQRSDNEKQTLHFEHDKDVEMTATLNWNANHKDEESDSDTKGIVMKAVLNWNANSDGEHKHDNEN